MTGFTGTLEVLICLMTYCLLSSFLLTSNAFPNVPSPIIRTFTYLSIVDNYGYTFFTTVVSKVTNRRYAPFDLDL